MLALPRSTDAFPCSTDAFSSGFPCSTVAFPSSTVAFSSRSGGPYRPPYIPQYEGKLLIAGGKFPDGCSKLLSEKVLATMAHDSVGLAVKSDKTILTLCMLEKKGAYKLNEISPKMRLLGRILVEARKNCVNQNASLKDVLILSNFDMMKRARDIGGYEENDGTSSKRSFKSLSTTITCGYEIRTAASIIESQALHQREINKVEAIGVFIRLCEKRTSGTTKLPRLPIVTWL